MWRRKILALVVASTLLPAATNGQAAKRSHPEVRRVSMRGGARRRDPLPTVPPGTRTYRWTDRGGDASWHNPRNWSVDGAPASHPPTRDDDCLFDNSSFPKTAPRVEVHTAAACHDMVWRRVHGEPSLSGGEIEIAGGLILDPTIGPLSVSFRFTSSLPNQVVDLAGRDATNVTLRFDGEGSWHFRSGLRAPRLFSPDGVYILMYRGTLYFGSLTHEIRALVDETTPAAPAAIHLGASAFVLKDAWQRRERDSSLVIHGERATLHCIATRDFFSFEDTGTHYHHVVVWPNVIPPEICAPSHERCDAAFIAATHGTRINHFVARAGTIVESLGGSDLHIGRLDLMGNEAAPTTWKASTPEQSFRVRVDKPVEADFCSISGFHAEGRHGTLRAGANCRDAGGNQGWSFLRFPNLPSWLQP